MERVLRPCRGVLRPRRVLQLPGDRRQGLTLVHFSAERERFLWDRGRKLRVAYGGISRYWGALGSAQGAFCDRHGSSGAESGRLSAPDRRRVRSHRHRRLHRDQRLHLHGGDEGEADAVYQVFAVFVGMYVQVSGLLGHQSTFNFWPMAKIVFWPTMA